MASGPDPNIYELQPAADPGPGFGSSRERVGRQAGSERLATSAWLVPPGQTACSFHWHYVEEEQLVVVDGRPLLRTPAGWRRLERGAVVAFLPGEAGAHQVHNDTAEPVLLLMISTHGTPDVVVYPDDDLVAVFDRPPGGELRLYDGGAEVAYDPGRITVPVPPTDIP